MKKPAPHSYKAVPPVHKSSTAFPPPKHVVAPTSGKSWCTGKKAVVVMIVLTVVVVVGVLFGAGIIKTSSSSSPSSSPAIGSSGGGGGGVATSNTVPVMAFSTAAAPPLSWLSMSSLTSTTAYVCSWTDRSSNSRGASQGSASLCPHYTTGAVGRYPALTFSGAGQYLQGNLPLPSSLTDFSIIALVSTAITSHNGIILGDAQQNWGFYYQNDNHLSLFTTSNIPESNQPVAATNVPVLVAMTYQASSHTVSLYQNGTLVYSQGGTTATFASTVFQVGAWTNGQNGWQGNIAEVVQFASALSSAQRVYWESNIAAAYGLPYPVAPTTLG